MMIIVEQAIIFLNADLNNPFGSLDAFIQTTNNDTYMRKNKINKLTVLKSGLNFERSHENTYFSLDAIGYSHLAIQNGEQWEYIYPRLNYKISDIEDDIFDGKVSLDNQFNYNKDLNENYTSLVSSHLNWNKNQIDFDSGIVFENKADFRVVSISRDNKSSKILTI